MALPLEHVMKYLSRDSSLQAQREEAVKKLKSIDRISEPISYEEFFKKYLVSNVPCVLTHWATDDWTSRSEWCSNEKISWDSLEKLFVDVVAPVSDCSKQQSYSQAKTDMAVKDFICRVRKRDEESAILYLKDWHFTRDFPEYKAYRTPLYFRSDWLNEFWESRKDCDDDDDDYRFVYIGPRGSWTPFHADVFMSFSWSANVCGRKRWIMFAPGYEQQLRDKFGHLPFDISQIDSLDTKEKCFEVIQESGEVIFVPSGWHHQVYNTEDTISINHNWINGCNIDLSWNYIKQRLHDVEQEIAEHKDMENWNEHCQLILRADCGMNFTDFYNLLFAVASNRLRLLLGDSVEYQNVDILKSDATNHQHHFELTMPERDNTAKINKSQEDLSSRQDTKIHACDDQSTEKQFSPKNEKYCLNGDKYFDVLGKGHAVYDLLRIQSLLETEFASERHIELDRTKMECLPDDFISRIRHAVSSVLG